MNVVESQARHWPEVAGLLRRSFPPHELGSLDEHEEAVASGALQVRVSLDDADRVAGCAVLRQLPLGATCLEFLAVDPDRRAGGVGRALLDDAVVLAAEHGDDWLVLEVEPPDTSALHPDHGDAARRMRFYERAGAFSACTGYGAPDLEAGTGIVDLELMVVPARPGATGPSLSQVVDWVRAMWGPGGYDRPADDPDLRTMLARLGY